MIQDVEQLLLAHGIKYQKKGNIIKCLCPSPSHNDRHIGSFSFDTIKGVGHCFACGCSVNIFSFNKLLGEKLEYKGDVNYEFTKSLKPKKEEVVYNKPIVYGKLYDPFYDNKVMDFLHGIGWSDEFIEEKGVKYCRYCEMIGENIANDIDEKPTVMENRICIPIYKDRKLVNYECRTFKNEFPKVKYVKSCSSNLLYNLENVDLEKPVILTESIKNLGHGWSVNKNIISSFGNQITDKKLEMLQKVKNLILFADFDMGGLTMVRKLREEYECNLRVTFCPKQYKKNNETKGFDMNDCSLDEIKFYLEHTMSAEKAERILSGKNEDDIFWT